MGARVTALGATPFSTVPGWWTPLESAELRGVEGHARRSQARRSGTSNRAACCWQPPATAQRLLTRSVTVVMCVPGTAVPVIVNVNVPLLAVDDAVMVSDDDDPAGTGFSIAAE